jgi:hypothetical protein
MLDHVVKNLKLFLTDNSTDDASTIKLLFPLTVARLFRTFPAKVAWKLEKILPLNKSCVKQLFQTPYRAKTIHKNLRNYKVSFGFLPKYL